MTKTITTKNLVKKYRLYDTQKERILGLLSTRPSGTDGVIGWIRASETSPHVHTFVDNDRKTFTFSDSGNAATDPWGGQKQHVHESLESHAGLKFSVSETALVRNTVWYKGVIEGEDKAVWVHNNAVLDKTEETHK